MSIAPINENTYFNSFTSKLVTKRSCTDQNERTAYSNKINKEIIQLEQWFSQMSPPSSSNKKIMSNEVIFNLKIIQIICLLRHVLDY